MFCIWNGRRSTVYTLNNLSSQAARLRDWISISLISPVLVYLFHHTLPHFYSRREHTGFAPSFFSCTCKKLCFSVGTPQWFWAVNTALKGSVDTSRRKILIRCWREICFHVFCLQVKWEFEIFLCKLLALVLCMPGICPVAWTVSASYGGHAYSITESLVHFSVTVKHHQNAHLQLCLSSSVH